MKKTLLVFAVCVSAIATAHADQLVVELNQKVEYLDNQNKELRNLVEELTHKTNVLGQKFDAFSSDIEMRLSSQAPAGNAGNLLPGGAPMALTGQNTPQTSILKDPSMGPGEGAVVPSAGLAGSDSNQGLDPKKQYENARSLLEQGDYVQAGNKFAEFVRNNPQDEHVPDANYWLGVSYLVRGEYESAAGTFAQVYKQHPNSRKAPDALIKMAKSLSALGRTQDACVTLTQLHTTFPDKLKAQYQQEWGQLACQ